jgi:creatinine amidohydrolase/Fe(II)-dependent formamide hydrolase-like protein
MSQPRNTRYLPNLTWQEVKALDKETGVVILPVGAIEQHGPHLPTVTDTLIVTSLLNAAMANLPDEVKAWSLPPLNYGKSNEHTGFPGTISLSTTTLIAVLHDIAVSVKSAGFRRLAFINGHGGNTALLDATARDIRAASGLMCFCLHPGSFYGPAYEVSPEERRFGFHAGESETSLILALAPELVHMDKATKHYPDYPETETNLFFFGGASSAWLTRDWSQEGHFGDATLGTAEKGQALIETAVKQLVPLITAISTFEVANRED